MKTLHYLITLALLSAATPATFSQTINADLSTGNVGIGTSVPFFKLDVNGQVNATEYLIDGQPAFSSDANGTPTFESIKVNQQIQIGNSTMYIGNNLPNQDVEKIYTTGNDLLIQSEASTTPEVNTIINANNKGMVGIGTSMPQAKLHFYRTDPTMKGLKIQTVSAANLSPGSTPENVFEIEIMPDPLVGGPSLYPFQVGYDGNVTIGAGANADNNFTVSCQLITQCSTGTAHIATSTSATGTGQLSFRTSNSLAGIEGSIDYNHSTDMMSFKTNKIADQMVIDKDGKVGIGTTAPSELLQIGDLFTFHSGGAKFIGYNTTFANGQDQRIADGFASNLRFMSNGDVEIRTIPNGTGAITDYTGFTLKNNGVLLIGDPNDLVLQNSTLNFDPDKYRLHVQNGILAERVRVAISGSGEWSDFVFDENYGLMDLLSLKNYIQQNKHLPDIPSASTVAKDGIDVAKMDALLLQKIEELTLYILHQNSEIELLKKEIRTIQCKEH